MNKRVADWMDGKVLGFQVWPAHLTVEQIRKILEHWEQKHPELLEEAVSEAA